MAWTLAGSASAPYGPSVTAGRPALSHADRTALVAKGARALDELGAVRRYSYWSDRRVRDIAADNSIELERRWRLGFTTPALWQFAPQAQLIEDRRTVQRHEIALKIESDWSARCELLTEAVVREVNEETGLLVERIGPLGRSPGWGLAPHCSAGPAIRAVIGPSSR